MRVLKFGGTSLADAAALERVAVIVSSREGPRTVVVSALAGVTDALVNVAGAAADDPAAALDVLHGLERRHHDLAGMVRDQRRRDLLRACIDGIATSARGAVAAIASSRRAAPPLFDRLVALGEVWSSRIVAAVLEDRGVSAQWLDARDVVRTDGRHQCARADIQATAAAVDRLVRPVLAFDRVAVLGGFIGSAPDGATTTLGRGGSDYSAALFGACLLADEIEIWTDVDGILTADPRLVATAMPLASLTYVEAQHLAAFGAKVLHPAAVQPAAERNIPLRILNSRRPEAVGTLIAASTSDTIAHAPRAVGCRRGVTLVEVVPRGVASGGPLPAEVLAALAKRGTPVVLAEVCGNGVSLAVDTAADLAGVCAMFSSSADVHLRTGLAAVCLIGPGPRGEAALRRDALAALGDTPVHMIARPSRTSPLALVVDDDRAHETVARLHDALVVPPPVEACA